MVEEKRGEEEGEEEGGEGGGRGGEGESCLVEKIVLGRTGTGGRGIT